MLLGLPGVGKSQFAKCLGKETGRPTLILDVGALMGSLVGQTESNVRQALKIADAMDYPPGYGRELGGDGEDQKELFSAMGIALVSGTAALAGALGFGWTLAGAEPQITTNVAPTAQEGLGVYAGYATGTRLYIKGGQYRVTPRGIEG